MIHNRRPFNSAHVLFRTLALATLVAAFAQVTLGGIVRVTDSGLGCPDWPLCHGKIIPPFELATLIEYSNRLSASALSVLALATVVVGLVYYRSVLWAVVTSLAALVFVVVAAVLGGVTVLTELAWWVVLFHLGVAEVVVAALVFAVIVGWRIGRQTDAEAAPQSDAGFNRLVLVAIAGVFILLLSGSYMVGYGAGSSCATWPLCRGSLFPEGAANAIHMGHRLLAALVGLLVAWVAASAWRRRSANRALGRAGAALAVAFIVQILAGAALVEAGFSAEMKALHLSLATLVWTALLFVAALAFVPAAVKTLAATPSTVKYPEVERMAL